jgi:hypothetical protein
MKRLGITLSLLLVALLPLLTLRTQAQDRDDRRPSGDLRITRAVYGAGKRTVDVTARLNGRVRDGQLKVPVSNDTMGGDPAHNAVKTLTVWYTFNGRAAQVTVNENDFLQLPAGDNGGPDNRGNDNRSYDNRGNGAPGDDHSYDQARMERVVLPPGTELAVLTDERIDSHDVVEGQTFRAEIAEDVRDTDGSIAIPRGSPAALITQRVEGNGDITLDVQSISVAGRRYRVSTQDNELQSNNRDGIGANQRTGEYVGGGAVIGAIIGAIAGGGKGAAIGAAAGAGAGAGTEIITRGKEVHVPAESVIRFRLDHPLRLHFWQ